MKPACPAPWEDAGFLLVDIKGVKIEVTQRFELVPHCDIINDISIFIDIESNFHLSYN